MRRANLGCIICKGVRKLCGRDKCPILTRFYYQKLAAPKLREMIFGESPNSIFVGCENYPNVFVGPMVSLENEDLDVADTPEKMYGLNINKILKIRYNLVRGKEQRNIFSTDKYIRELQELSISKKPVDIEIVFKKKPSLNLSFSPILQPIGFSGLIKKFKITENPKIENRIYKIIEDEITTTEMCIEFYNLNLEPSRIAKILSAGVMGIDKKLVPTRWSITAVDDILGKNLIEEIKELSLINDYLLFENEYMNNRFFIILMPGNWEFEQIETWFPGTLWNLSQRPTISNEYEFYNGKKEYAIKQSGGYYAARFAVLDYLYKIRRQAKILIIREVYKGYDIPLGVWVVRETIRKAFNKRPLKFNSLEEIFRNLKSKINPEK
ncbi:MAG TPA: hypothetical protein EYP80_00580, partial [Candidatus Aenigmarchaeota archaeon]|nr:hypothetical protein [Candidatus Aenigmarchaeota archaeon]